LSLPLIIVQVKAGVVGAAGACAGACAVTVTFNLTVLITILVFVTVFVTAGPGTSLVTVAVDPQAVRLIPAGCVFLKGVISL